jgi:hypothetical protein
MLAPHRGVAIHGCCRRLLWRLAAAMAIRAAILGINAFGKIPVLEWHWVVLPALVRMFHGLASAGVQSLRAGGGSWVAK